MSSTAEILAKIGKDLPDRTRVPAKTSTSIKMVPTGEIALVAAVDTFTDLKVKSGTDKLAGKDIVLIFGRSTHQLTKTFLVPKLALIYHNMTNNTTNVEFLYVSVPEETKAGHDRVIKSHRKCWSELHTPKHPISCF